MNRKDSSAPSQNDKKKARNDKIKIAIGMSGGVDSSVAAKILKDQGYDVVGFMLKLWLEDPSVCDSRGRDNTCCDIEGLEDAKRVATMLDIPFYVVDARAKFKKDVADYFVEEYKNLRTPNPCVRCNELIKFGWLLDFAKSVGCQYLATGHYARIITNKIQDTRNKKQTIQQFNNSTSNRLLKGVDDNKDQSYFLYRLNQEQLSRIIFPLGEMTKDETRALAKKWNLPVFEKRESQEICFIKDKDFRQFLRRNIPEKYFKTGNIVNLEGDVLGKHSGLINYTIGQRKGIDQISDNRCQITDNRIQITDISRQTAENKQPLYVVGFNVPKNQLIVGDDSEIYKKEMIVGDLSWINSSCQLSVISYQNIKVKIRYRHPAVDCKIKNTDNSKQITVEFSKLQRAITPGQSAVFYLGDEVLGGGIIS